jgi:serine protease Do
MNSLAKMFYRSKLAAWLIAGLAAIALGTLGASKVLADDDDDEKGEAWLGVALQELTPSLRDAMDLDSHVKGLVIAGVMPNSPAQKAGLQEQDVILTLNGRTVDSVEEATGQVGNLKPGSRLTISVLRDGRRRQFTATLAEHDENRDSSWLRGLEGQPPENMDVPTPPMPPRMADPDDLPEGHRGYLGVSTIELGKQLAEYFGVRGDGGVLVTEVAEDSPAEAAGLRAGDIILSVEDSRVDGPDDLRRLVRAHDPEDQVQIVVQRRGQVQTLNAKLGAAKDLGMFAPRARHGFMGPQMRQHLDMMGPQMRERMHEHLMMLHQRQGGAQI